MLRGAHWFSGESFVRAVYGQIQCLLKLPTGARKACGLKLSEK